MYCNEHGSIESHIIDTVPTGINLHHEARWTATFHSVTIFSEPTSRLCRLFVWRHDVVTILCSIINNAAVGRGRAITIQTMRVHNVGASCLFNTTTRIVNRLFFRGHGFTIHEMIQRLEARPMTRHIPKPLSSESRYQCPLPCLAMTSSWNLSNNCKSCSSVPDPSPLMMYGNRCTDTETSSLLCIFSPSVNSVAMGSLITG